jgi:hypothetical protein
VGACGPALEPTGRRASRRRGPGWPSVGLGSGSGGGTAFRLASSRMQPGWGGEGKWADRERVFAKALTNTCKRSPTSLIRRVLRAAQDGIDAGPIAGLFGKHADHTLTSEVQLTSEVERFLQVGLTLY